MFPCKRIPRNYTKDIEQLNFIILLNKMEKQQKYEEKRKL
jgi:hypothetical protein